MLLNKMYLFEGWFFFSVGKTNTDTKILMKLYGMFFGMAYLVFIQSVFRLPKANLVCDGYFLTMKLNYIICSSSSSRSDGCRSSSVLQ